MKRSTAATALLLASTTLTPATHASPSPTPDLVPPAEGKIRVAVVLAPGATVIDFAGPWEVFQDTHVFERGDTMDQQMPFELYTVAESREPVRATAGLTLVPDYTFDDAPQPRVIVVPALHGSPRLHAWLREASKGADVTMSVCTGAFQLARAGLLDGLAATTHHAFFDAFAEQFPDVELRRGVRWVDNGRIATAAGLTSGIDMAIHVVDRYFGAVAAGWVAEYMEHASRDWQAAGASHSSARVHGD